MSQEKGKFFENFTIRDAVTLTTILILAFASLYIAMHDTQPNKTAIDLAYEKTKQIEAVEKTKQLQAKNNGGGKEPSFFSPSETSSRQVQQQSCYQPDDYNLGSYLLGRGVCVTLDNSSGQITSTIVLGTESPITSVEGDGDFVVMSSSTGEKCDSSGASDKCVGWIKTHQEIGREDARFHVPRYWLSYTITSGKVIFKT